MKWFNNLKVGRKVLLSCGIFIILIVAIALQGIRGSNDASIGFHKFYDAEFTPVRELNRIMRNLLQIRVNMLQQYIAVQANDFEEIQSRRKNSEELRVKYLADWESFKKTIFSDEGRKLVSEWEALSKAPAELRKKFDEAIDKKDIAMAAEDLKKWGESFRLLRDKTDEMIISKNKFAEEDLKHQDAESRMTIMINIIILIASLIIGAIITMVLSGSVSKPVNKGLEFAKKIAEGDFTERIDLDQEDELGQLGKALNISADNLEDLVSNIIVAAQNLAQAVEQIASGNQNLSQRTSEQASSLEEIASTIEETTATINQNAENAGNASKTSQASEKLAMEGGRLVSDAVVSINEINQVSKKIGDIIAVINEIAFQTNLLALNAAVEAARAGEQGRGFAVVAGEVRNLAQRSGNAAKEIGDLIKNSIEKIEVGTDKANKSGEALTEIIGSVKNVNTVIAEIAAASLEQKQGINQINIAVTEMDTMTQQNAALVEETASASEEMSNQAQELLVMMERFKIREASKNDTYKTKHKEVHLRGAETKASSGKRAAAAITHKPASGSGKPADGIKGLMKDEGFEEF